MNKIIPNIEIINSRIELSNPSAIQIRTARRGFKALFGKDPVLRLRGYFPPDAVRGPSLQGANLTNDSYPITFVGVAYLIVSLKLPIGPQSTVELIPELGRNVTVYLSLP
jgi:hypothetical protein